MLDFLAASMSSPNYPTAPPQWSARPTAVLVASGPSLTKADVDYCRGTGLAKVLVVNNAWKLAPWADALYACDAAWWNYHKGVPEFQGQKWTQVNIAGDIEKEKTIERWGLRCVGGADRNEGFSFDNTLIHYGGNSGFQAVNLAIHFGAINIVLLGYDMKVGKGGKTHFDGDHPGSLNRTSAYKDFVAAFNKAATGDLERRGITVYNCTRETALTCFPRMSLDDAFGAIESGGIREVSASV